MFVDIISKYDDVIDSRDVIARIAALQDYIADLQDDAMAALQDEHDEFCFRCLSVAIEELRALVKLAEEAEGYFPDWSYGVTLIRDTYFKEYAQDFAESIGPVPSDLPWPVRCIDWDAAADELKEDYTCVDFGGIDYWAQ